MFNKKINFEITKKYDGKSAGVESKSWVADISKVQKKFNWYPKYTLEEGIFKFIKVREDNE